MTSKLPSLGAALPDAKPSLQTHDSTPWSTPPSLFFVYWSIPQRWNFLFCQSEIDYPTMTELDLARSKRPQARIPAATYWMNGGNRSYISHILNQASAVICQVFTVYGVKWLPHGVILHSIMTSHNSRGHGELFGVAWWYGTAFWMLYREAWTSSGRTSSFW